MSKVDEGVGGGGRAIEPPPLKCSCNIFIRGFYSRLIVLEMNGTVN